LIAKIAIKRQRKRTFSVRCI